MLSFFANVANFIYQFLVSFSTQINNAWLAEFGEIMVATPITVFWFIFVINLIVIPFLFLLPKLERSAKREKYYKNKNKDN